MDLKERKYINNTNSLPKFYDGVVTARFVNGLPATDTDLNTSSPGAARLSNSQFNSSNIAQAGVGALNLASNLYQQSQSPVSSQELLNSAGTNSNSYKGINYQTTNIPTGKDQLDQAKRNTTTGALGGMASGAAAGAVLGPWGAAAGALIGGIGGFLSGKSSESELKKLIAEALREAKYKNAYNLSLAQQTAMDLESAEKYGDLTSQSLYHAALGVNNNDIINKYTKKTYTVNTAQGLRKGKQNAWVSKGEVIESGKTGQQYTVKSGKNDTARANIQPGDTVYSNKLINPETGHPIAKDAKLYASIGQSDRLKMNQQISRELSSRRNKNMRSFAYGGEWYLNAIPAATNLFLAARKFNEASGDVYKPDTYVQNPYANKALSGLGEISTNYYPIWNKAYETEQKALNAIKGSGGLSSGQRLLAYSNIAKNTQQNNAQALLNAQIQDNAYKSLYYNSLLQAGESERSARQSANQYDTNIWLAGENARKQGRDAAMYDISNTIGKYMSNEFDRMRFNRIMDLYEDENGTSNSKSRYNKQLNKRNKQVAKYYKKNPLSKQARLATQLFRNTLTPSTRTPSITTVPQLRTTVGNWPFAVNIGNSIFDKYMF